MAHEDAHAAPEKTGNYYQNVAQSRFLFHEDSSQRTDYNTVVILRASK